MKNGFTGKMDLQEKWICRKNGFAGKMEFAGKMDLQENGFAAKMDLAKSQFYKPCIYKMKGVCNNFYGAGPWGRSHKTFLAYIYLLFFIS